MTPTPVQPQVTTGMPTDDERTWGMLAHLSGLVSGFLIPIIILLTKGKESPWVRTQAIEALNFHITVFIAAMVSIPLMFVAVGICTLILAAIYGFVFAIVAGVKAYSGEPYRYPFALRLLN